MSEIKYGIVKKISVHSKFSDGIAYCQKVVVSLRETIRSLRAGEVDGVIESAAGGRITPGSKSAR